MGGPGLWADKRCSCNNQDRTALSLPFQDLIQHCQSRNDQKRYRCAECDRLCTADEAWLVSTKADVETAPRCFRCIIVKQAANDSASTLPEAMESVTDTFKRHDSDLSRLRRRMETFSNEQREWANSVQQAAWNMKSRVDDIVQASQALAKATLEDVDKLNNEFQLLNVQTNSVNVPESLEGLGPFKQSIQDTSSKLDQLAEARRRTITRANVALNSLAIGLDCLLNAGDDLKANREDGAGTPGMVRGDADGFVTPPQERATDQQLAADTLGPNGTPMASPTSSSAFQGASAAGATGQRENVFSVRGSPRGQYRVYAVRVTRRRPARGGLARPSPPPNP